MKVLSQVIDQIEENKKELEFLPTGLHKLDEALDGGFMKKELVVLGGSTGIGKSYLAGQIMTHIALKGFKSAYFSLEISNEMVVARLLGQSANIKSSHILSKQVTGRDEEGIETARAQMIPYEDYMHFYDDTYLFEEIKNVIISNSYEFVVIDFIQNVMMHGLDEYQKLSLVALELQRLAKQTNSCILILSQLSNAMARDGSGAILEYKGSGSIATVCDLGFFIQRGDADLGRQNELTLLLRKNRRGISGLTFQFTFTTPGGFIV